MKELIKYLNENTQPKKLKIRLYKTIMQGVLQADYGEIFSTSKSDRIYVVTKPTWGKKSKLSNVNKVYKGFPGDTPLNYIKAYADRVRKRYGKTHKANEDS